VAQVWGLCTVFIVQIGLLTASCTRRRRSADLWTDLTILRGLFVLIRPNIYDWKELGLGIEVKRKINQKFCGKQKMMKRKLLEICEFSFFTYLPTTPSFRPLSFLRDNMIVISL
jgi:hypothetical protein